MKTIGYIPKRKLNGYAMLTVHFSLLHINYCKNFLKKKSFPEKCSNDGKSLKLVEDSKKDKHYKINSYLFYYFCLSLYLSLSLYIYIYIYLQVLFNK